MFQIILLQHKGGSYDIFKSFYAEDPELQVLELGGLALWPCLYLWDWDGRVGVRASVSLSCASAAQHRKEQELGEVDNVGLVV